MRWCSRERRCRQVLGVWAGLHPWQMRPKQPEWCVAGMPQSPSLEPVMCSSWVTALSSKKELLHTGNQGSMCESEGERHRESEREREGWTVVAERQCLVIG